MSETTGGWAEVAVGRLVGNLAVLVDQRRVLCYFGLKTSSGLCCMFPFPLSTNLDYVKRQNFELVEAACQITPLHHPIFLFFLL